MVHSAVLMNDHHRCKGFLSQAIKSGMTVSHFEFGHRTCDSAPRLTFCQALIRTVCSMLTEKIFLVCGFLNN